MCKKVIVIGGGPAGMMAAGISAQKGNKVILIEKNEKLGKKLYITGKGRCNITNASEPENLINNTISNPYFMYSSYYTFDSNSTIDFFEGLGLKTKVERGQRVFPVSDKASDVIKAFSKFLNKNNVDVRLNTKVVDVIKEDNKVVKIKLSNGKFLECDSLIIATGGLSYPTTGSTGDGHNFAKKLSHNVTELTPSLVPLKVKELNICEKLQGLSLKNVELKLIRDNKVIFKDFGEMLFTHFGISGPLVLTLSSQENIKNCPVEIDLKPSLTEKELDKRIIRDFEKFINKDFKNSLNELLPQKIIPVIIELSKIEPLKKVNTITKEERLRLVSLIKGLKLHIIDNMGFTHAVITRGGVSTDEIDPSTMRSKLIENLYFAGEVIDVDCLTGGYNLQVCYSTGYLAGINS